MPKAIAIVPVDLERCALGLPSQVGRDLGGRTVLEHTIRRVASVRHVRAVVLVHDAAQDPFAILGPTKFPRPVRSAARPGYAADAEQTHRIAARKWSLTSWRGGLGGMTCFDELLPAGPLADAMDAHNADAALLVGGDWPLVDTELCGEILERHLDAPEALQMTFSQAPPGLGGVVAGRKLIDELAGQTGGSFGRILSYQPNRAQADPIGRDMCVQIEAAVRNAHHRFIYDTGRSSELIRRVVERLGDRAGGAGAGDVVGAADAGGDRVDGGLPQQVTLELTPRRDTAIDGPLAAQSHVDFERPDMDEALALRILRQLGDAGDVALRIGGLGDALLHERWEALVEAAHEAGVLGIALETDLLVDEATARRLAHLPIDVVSVRLNADTAATYRQVMTAGEEDRFATLVHNLETIVNETRARRRDGQATPWVVPRLIKTKQTDDDLETFFDRWTHFTGHAVIEPATTGRGPEGPLMADLSPLDMAPPRRFACRQLERRMTILSTGKVALCDQDWLASRPLGDAAESDLSAIWRDAQTVRSAHGDGRWDELALCGDCREWHRP